METVGCTSRITLPSAYWRTEFTYDARGRLRKKVDYSAHNGSSYTSVVETRYIYDGMRVIQERNSSNTPQVSYTRGLDLSGSLEDAGGIGGMLARTAHSGANDGTLTHAFYHADGNGNITYLIKPDKTIGASYVYDPFGRTLGTPGGSLGAANTYRFSSKELMVASGLYYYGFRFYDNLTQRWLNRDPLGDYASFRQAADGKTWREKQRLRLEALGNLYVFVRNRTPNMVDVNGLTGWQYTDSFGRPLPQPNYNSDMPCARAIKETLEMTQLGNRGYEGYPEANDDDHLQHCLTSCRLAPDCGSGVAWLLGWFKESKDLIHGGTAGDTVADLNANTHGRGGKNCPEKSCEDYCSETRGDY